MDRVRCGPAAPFPYRHEENEDHGPYQGWTIFTMTEEAPGRRILQIRECYPKRQLNAVTRALIVDMMREAIYQAALEHHRNGLVR